MPDLSDIITAWNAISLPTFTYDGIALSEAQGNSFPAPYSAPQFINNSYFLYTYTLNNPVIKYSTDPLGDDPAWISVASQFPYGSVFFDEDAGKFFCANHVLRGPVGQKKFYYAFWESTNGINFTQIAELTVPHGEDISVIKLASGVYRAYARTRDPRTDIRCVGWMESTDFIHWSPLVEVLVPDLKDNGREYYSMSVIEIDGDGFYGFMNTLNPTNQQMTVRLWWSADGKTNWIRINYGNPILPLTDTVTPANSRKQLYAHASIIGTDIVIYTISAKFRHDEIDQGSQFYYTERWHLPVASIATFKLYPLA